MPETTPFLTVRTRETLPGSDEGFEQVVEILDGETVVGQLPVTRAEYEMLPQNLGKLKIELIVKRADIRTHA
jgi:hypothetical protein